MIYRLMFKSIGHITNMTSVVEKHLAERGIDTTNFSDENLKLAQTTLNEAEEVANRFIYHQEFLVVEFDTEKQTATVINVGM